MNIRRHIRRPRASTVLASLALFVALGGTATAATLITGASVKNGTVTGKDLKNSTLTGSSVKNGSLSSSDVSKSVKGSLKGASGDQGPAGQAGAGGAQGAPGPNGVRTPQVEEASANIAGSNQNTVIATKAVPAGGYLVSVTGYMFSFDVSRVTCRLFNGADQVDQVEWDVTASNQRKPTQLTAVVNVTNGALSLQCQKTGAGAGMFADGELIATPTS